MARPKKSTEENAELSESEVWSVVEFARNLYSGGLYPGIFTPDLVNSRLKDITMNPLAATEDTLTRALQNPKDSELELQSFSQDFENQSMPYKRLLGLLGHSLSWNFSYSCINAEYDDYKKPAYKKDLKIVAQFFDRFDYKKEFSACVKQMLRNETTFVCPRMEGEKIVLQELPSSPNYTKITGRWDFGFLPTFSMQWFLLPGVDINMYPNFFKKKYLEIFGGKGDLTKYNPSMNPEMRDSSFAYWVDVPVDVCWVFKMTPEVGTRLPFYSPLFNDLVLQSQMRNLQKNINLSLAKRIIVGQIPLIKDAKANIADALAIKPDLLGKFMALVQAAVGDSVRFSSLPLEDIKGISFESDNDVYDSWLRTSLASSGVNSNLIFTSNVKPNAIETQLSLNVDEQLMLSLYNQFNSFCEYHVNKLTSRFKFQFRFEGTQFFTNQNDRFEKVMALAEKGIVLPHKIAAAVGMSPFEFQRQLDEARAMGWTDTLTPIINAAQMSGKSLESGRPQKSSNDLSDSGSETRSAGSNIEKGGSV